MKIKYPHPPPSPANNMINETKEGEDMQDEDLNQDMNYFGEFSAEGFLTKDEYLNSKFFDANVYQTESDLAPHVSAEINQSEPIRSINLRSSPK